MDTLLPSSREALADLCRRWRILELSVFGSAARGSSHADSDVGKRVDLVEDKAIRNPYRKASILRDKSILYAA
jgi:uncharacterized protein